MNPEGIMLSERIMPDSNSTYCMILFIEIYRKQEHIGSCQELRTGGGAGRKEVAQGVFGDIGTIPYLICLVQTSIKIQRIVHQSKLYGMKVKMTTPKSVKRKMKDTINYLVWLKKNYK